MLRYARYFALVGLIGVASPAQAQETSQGVVLHGFGGWAYGNTGGNRFLGGNVDGDFRKTNLALNVAAVVSDKLSVHGQADLEQGPEGTETELEFAFAEYRLNDQVSFRIGSVKHPFGIYAELQDVGTLRPFLDLPQGVYGPVGFMGESYKGVGITGNLSRGAWTLGYDVYGGGYDKEKLFIPEGFYHGEVFEDEENTIELQSTRNVIGGRAVLRTPLPGLSVGSSAYIGILNEPAANRRTVVAAQLEYRRNAFSIQSEFAHEHQVEDEDASGFYIQAAYRLTSHWQVAGQYDYLKNVFVGVDPSAAPSLQYHKEGAFALNYWFSRSLVLKAEYHRVHGNRFALPDPDELADLVAAGELQTTTNLVQFGGQFSF
jgi:hypothetical protein